MASTIAAITTGVGGIVTTADASGNLSLLSGATTVVAVTSTGVAVTGTLTTTGNTILGDATTDTLNVGAGGLVKDASGNVGIGTSSPTVKLQVNGVISSNDTVQATSGTTVNVLSTAGGGEGVVGTISNHALQFRTNNTERMRIDSSGNVGIGTASPTSFGAGSQGLTINGTGNYQNISWNVNGTSVAVAYTNGTSGFLLGTENSSPLQFQTVGVERMRIDPSGVLWIGGSTTASGAMQLSRGGSGGGCIVQFNKPNSGATNVILNYYGATYVGGMNIDNTSTSFLTSSDVRLKENIVNASSSLDSINAIKIRSFDWKNDGSHQNYGVIAQELIDVASECVSRGVKEEDTWGVDYSKLVPRMIKAIQEQQAIIIQLQADVATLKGVPA